MSKLNGELLQFWDVYERPLVAEMGSTSTWAVKQSPDLLCPLVATAGKTDCGPKGQDWGQCAPVLSGEHLREDRLEVGDGAVNQLGTAERGGGGSPLTAKGGSVWADCVSCQEGGPTCPSPGEPGTQNRAQGEALAGGVDF